MKRYSLLAATVAVGGAVAFQGSVNLQGSTPGTAQNGHLHITGKAKAGVFEAISTAPTGITYGGDFRSASSSGRGVLGNASATTGATYGGLFQAASNGGRAVAGIAGSSTGTTYGGFFSSLSNQGRGVYGQATSASGTTYGVYGKATSASGFGVYSEGNLHATGVISGNGSGLTNLNVAIPNPLTVTGANSTHIVSGHNQSTANGASGVYGLASGASGQTYGVQGTSGSTNGFGVFGAAPAASGPNCGGRFESGSSSGTGVFGEAKSTSGTTYGVFGTAASPNGYGVYSNGRMHATGVISGNGSGLTSLSASSISAGVLDVARLPVPLLLSGSNSTAVLRVENTSDSTGSAAILGDSTSLFGTKYGVYGKASGSFGVGLYGQGSTGLKATGVSGVEATGTEIGVLATATSPTGRAVVGNAQGAGTNSGGFFTTSSSSTDSTGVYGYASSPSGITYGLWGQTLSSTGFANIGIATAISGVTYGIYGRTTSSAGWAVFAQGASGASGTKSFRIDHPLDPENKYLLHYAAESPKPQNFYVGNVTTDGAGRAWVDLPDYFSEINTNFKYQLTVVEDDATTSFVQVKVGKKIKDGRFLIMSSAPNTEVSWRVDADRNDLFVRNRPPKDVIDKEGPEKGTYQHPEFYGLGSDRGMNPGAMQQKRAISPAK